MQAQCGDFNIFLPSDCSVLSHSRNAMDDFNFFYLQIAPCFRTPAILPAIRISLGFAMLLSSLWGRSWSHAVTFVQAQCDGMTYDLGKKNLQFFKNWKIREDGISRVTTSVRFCLTTAALPGACNTSRCKGRSLHDLTSRLSHPTPKPSSIFLHLFLSACRNFSVKCSENVLSSSLCLLIWLTYFQYMKS